MGKVSVVKVNGSIRESLKDCLNLIGGLDKFVGHPDRVMLKPNLNDTELVTNIVMVEELIKWLKDYGVKSIVVGESTFGTAPMTEGMFRQAGYTELCKRYGIQLINFNRSQAMEVDVKNPLVAPTLKIAREVFETDCLINLPVMKVHYATGVTLAMKNLKGLLVGPEKRRFHDIGLDQAIVDLNNTIKPALTIVDATTAMERMGPKGGDLVSLNMLMAGQNSAEVDWVGSKIMGYTLDEVKHLKYYIEMHALNVDDIKIAGPDAEKLKVPLKKVNLDKAIPPGFAVYSKDACSSCMNALILSCGFLDGDVSETVNVYLGSDREGQCSGDVLSLAFGNCALKNYKAALEVKGCPPFPYELKHVLLENGILKTLNRK